jgi:hypothetical protein
MSVFIFKDDAAGIPLPGDRGSAKLGFQSESWREGGLRYFIISDASAADVHSLRELLKNAAHS